MKATREDVIAYYEGIFGRTPESEEVIQHQLAGEPTQTELARRFVNSVEFNRTLCDRFGMFSFYSREINSVEVDVSAKQLTKLLSHVRATWVGLGETEPHFSVLTNPAYRSQNLTGPRIEQFYATGAADAQTFFNCCARNGVDPRVDGAILELGCGIGRVAEHLAPRYATYVGVDISASHLAAAQERADKKGMKNVELSTLKAFLDGAGGDYDAMFSLIVLQHNPPPVMKYLLARMLKRLRPGGVAFFQIPSHLFNYRFDVQAYFAGAYLKNEMEMHALPQRHVFDVVRASGCLLREAFFDGKAGNLGFSYSYLIQKPAA